MAIGKHERDSRGLLSMNSLASEILFGSSQGKVADDGYLRGVWRLIGRILA
jgi:hypothetical protein